MLMAQREINARGLSSSINRRAIRERERAFRSPNRSREFSRQELRKTAVNDDDDEDEDEEDDDDDDDDNVKLM